MSGLVLLVHCVSLLGNVHVRVLLSLLYFGIYLYSPLKMGARFSLNAFSASIRSFVGRSVS